MRYVVWLMGCLLRCQYCHNPDTLAMPPSGERRSADDVLADVAKYAGFLRGAGGGFTVSGGEPLVQAPFALNLLRGAKALGIHTALDTNGYLGANLADGDFAAIDLVLLDLKAHGDAQHRRVTGVTNKPILAFAERLAELGQPFWVRCVLVPGLTDDPDELRRSADFVAGLSSVERLEVLPFHQMARDKWRELGIAYPLENTPVPTAEQMSVAREIFRAAGCPVA